MPLFLYEAKNIKGSIFKGSIEAIDELAVENYLRLREYYPVKISCCKENLDIGLLYSKRNNIKEISIFCRKLSTVISSGIHINSALRIVLEQTENVRIKKIIIDVYNYVQMGKELSSAMKSCDAFPNLLIKMIAVGELTGRIDVILEDMANYYEKEYRLRKRINQSLTYPLIVVIFTFLVVNFLLIRILPNFIEILTQFNDVQLPLMTRILISFNNSLFHKNLLIVTSISFVLGLVLRLYKIRSLVIFFDRLKISLPFWGNLYRKVIAARFSRAFGMMLESGISVVESINMCSEIVNNEIVKMSLNNACESIKKGMSLGEVLSEIEAFPKALNHMIRVGEESGKLDVMLKKTSDFLDQEVEINISQLVVLIEPVVMVILSLIIGFIVIAVMQPITQMYQMIN
jgi:type IV pilus assembly protein PilC